MPNGNRSPIGRRTFLTGVGAGGALLVSGCSVFGGGTPTTRTETVQAPPPVDPLLTLIATTRLHLARIDAAITAIAADQAGATLLTAIRADRAAHLDALVAEQARSAGGELDPSGSSSAPASIPNIEMPSDTASAIAAVRADAENAQLQFTDGVSATGRYRAAIFASIAACLATHRSVLV